MSKQLKATSLRLIKYDEVEAAVNAHYNRVGQKPVVTMKTIQNWASAERIKRYGSIRHRLVDLDEILRVLESKNRVG